MNAPAGAANHEQRSMAGRQLGRYEVLSQLAAGGMAAVYVARAQGVAGFERLVAIKVLHPHLAYEEEFISMFLDEARLAARIRHPNVVPTLDISDSGGDGYFLVMDYIEGDHLGALLGKAAKQGQRLPAPVVCRILMDALAGLGAAHRLTDEQGQPLNIVHRDVSPHNVMVGVDGISRLTDFGVAKAEVRMASTRAGQFKGKLSYMAPEQASTGHADQRSDLFSMGIILWESLTGRRLFRGENNASTLSKILQDPIPMPSEMWPELAAYDDVLGIALDRDPDKRFQNADEFIEAIEVAAQGSVATVRQVASIARELVTEKLEKERARIREAIEQLGRAEMGEAMLPIPRDGSASSLSRGGMSGQRPLTRPSPDFTGSLSYPQQPAPRSKGLVFLVSVLVALVLVGGGVLLSELLDEDPAQIMIPPPATTLTTPAAAPSPSVVSMPAPREEALPAREARPEPAVVHQPDRVFEQPSRPHRGGRRAQPPAPPPPVAAAPPAVRDPDPPPVRDPDPPPVRDPDPPPRETGGDPPINPYRR